MNDKPETQSVVEPAIQSESEAVKEVEIPKLTLEQKLIIRDAQVQALKLASQARLMLDNSANADRQIATYINQLASELKVDGEIYAFDIESLNFYKKAK